MKTSSSVRSSLSLILLAVLGMNAEGATLLTDRFSDGNRTEDPAWYWLTTAGSASRVDTVANNAWTVGISSAGSSTSYEVAYFNPTTLTVGSSITFSFSFSYAADSISAGNGFRFGLLNSQESRVDADSLTSVSNAAFTDNLGYGVFYTLQSAAGNYSLVERSGTSANVWSATAFATALKATSSSSSSSGSTYTASLTLNYISEDNLTITAVVDGTTLTVIDTTPATLTYDMISIYAGGAHGALTLSEINVTTTAVPEPSSVSMVIGGAMLVAAGALARKRRP